MSITSGRGRGGDGARWTRWGWAGMAEVDVREKTYTFLRMTLVALLVGLGVAVIWQTYRQGWQILDSVSAYYYTPAQPIFVGALIGLGACMIALRGGNTPEEVFLNLGGMFAAGVAIVPTSRGADYRTAIEACRQPDSPRSDCPTVRALEQATRANIENSLVALLVVGALALTATWFLASRDTSPGGGTRSLAFRWGFWTSVALLAVTAVLLVVNFDVIVANYHFICAVGLFVCIVAVAVSNAVRREGIEVPGSGTAMAGPGLRAGLTALRPAAGGPNVYAGFAWALLAVAVVGVIAVRLGLVSLFWLELAAALLFILFWLTQTFAELPGRARGANAGTAGDTAGAPSRR
jgi:hypothetical protein